tara:strand:- start:189 stop:524 length:336 start_codon:yes stop_codon:yes gene_type:complete
MQNYVYKATIESIYDGDTVTCTIDCGFGVKLTKQKIRLYGINCPEMRGDNKVKGKESRDALRAKLMHKDILLKTIKDKKGKYGRYLGILYLGEENINDWIVDNNYGIKANY